MNAKVPVLPLWFALVTATCLGLGVAAQLCVRSLGAPGWVGYVGGVLTIGGLIFAAIPIVVIIAVRLCDRRSRSRRHKNNDGEAGP